VIDCLCIVVSFMARPRTVAGRRGAFSFSSALLSLMAFPDPRREGPASRFGKVSKTRELCRRIHRTAH